MTPKLFFTVWAAVLMLASCNQGPAKTGSQTAEAAPTGNAPQATATDGIALAYHHLTGTIGNLPVVMDMVQRRGDTTSIWEYTGTYYYVAKGQPISIYGSEDSLGQLRFTEYVAGDETGILTGRLTDGGYEGTWASPKGGKVLPVKLATGTDGHVPFTGRYFADEMHLERTKNGKPIRITAGYNEAWLMPNSGDAALDGFLSKAIMAAMSGDSLAALHRTPEALFKVARDGFFEFSRPDMSDRLDYEMESDIDTDEDEYVMTGYENSISAEVLYNQNGLLTLGCTYYAYTGGAHGNYGTTLYSYDLANRRRYTLADVLQPGYEATLTKALDKAVRTYYSIPAKEPLSNTLFSDEMQLTDNFGVLGTGLLFVYQPYEIAAYALGAPSLFVPFSELKGVLRPDFAK